MIRMGLGHTGRNRSDAYLRDKLDAHSRIRIRVLQVENQLREIFDRINIMMRRRANQPNPGRGITNSRDGVIHLCPGQLTALSGFSTLRDFDLNFVRVR